jgi:hypothetical protein
MVLCIYEEEVTTSEEKNMNTQDILNSLARMKWYLEKGDYNCLQVELEDRLRVTKEYQAQEFEMYKDFIRKSDPKSRLLSEEEWSNDDEMERMKFKYGNTEEETMEPTV